MPNTASCLDRLPASAIGGMSRLAKEHQAVDLASGTPDFDPPSELVEAAERALRNGYHQYAHAWGAPRFRQALARKHRHFSGLEIDPEAHITVTCGSTEAMMIAVMATCEAGDRTIVLSPYYETHSPDSVICGAEPIYVPLRPPEFTFDPDEVRKGFQQGAKTLMLCNPSNPAGKVFTPQELQTIAELVLEYDAFVIVDEVYEHIVYDPHRHTYFAGLPGMFERTLSIGSLSKTFHITGWRLGYVIAPQRLTEHLRKLHVFVTLGTAAPLQEAAVTALEFPPSYYSQLKDDYARRRDILLGYLDRAGWSYIPPQGAFYVLADISPFGMDDDGEFCRWLTREIGVAVVPGSYFFHEPVNHLVRLNFAKRDETLKEAGERLLRLREYT